MMIMIMTYEEVWKT